MNNDRLTFTLMDMGYKKAGPVQIYDQRTCYEDGNIMPFPVQLAIVTHALMLNGKRHGDIYQSKCSELVEAWTTSLDSAKTKLNSSIVSEPGALQYSLFQDVFKAPFPGPENPKFTFIDLFAGIGGFRMALQNLGGQCVFSSELGCAGPKNHIMPTMEKYRLVILLRNIPRNISLTILIFYVPDFLVRRSLLPGNAWDLRKPEVHYFLM